MADNEAHDIADQPPASGDDEAREFHKLDSKHSSQESNSSTNYSFQPMNNLTVLAARLDEAYCNIASLMDEKAQLKQQLE